MGKRDHTITIALCASLVAHGLGVRGLVEFANRQMGDGYVYQSGYGPGDAKDDRAVSVAQIPATDDDMGERHGTGDAANSIDSDKTFQAQEADQVQAFLSRDPEGPGQIGNKPSMSLLNPGENGDGAPPGQPGASGSPASAMPMIAAADPSPLLVQPKGPSLPAKFDQSAAEQQPRVAQASQPPPVGTSAELAKAPDALKPPQAAQSTKLTLPTALPELPVPTLKGPTPSPADSIASAIQPGTPPAPTDRVELRAPEAPPAPKPPDQKIPAPAPAAQQAVPQPPSPPAHAAPPTPPVSPAVASAAGGAGGKPGPTVSAADPAPMSDSESDPFGKTAAITFSNGRVVARSGRKVKTVRPNITDAGQIDAMLVSRATVVFKVKIDESGTVQDVKKLVSSGSDSIDLPCERALYEWVFDPTLDDHGRPIADQLLIRLNFR